MVVNPTTNLVPTPTSPRGDAQAIRVMRDRMEGSETGNDVTTLAFEALLDALRSIPEVNCVRGGDKRSPTQMFEQNISDPHDRRLAALTAESRGDRLRAADSRIDASGGHANKAPNAGPSTDTRATVSNSTLESAGIDMSGIRSDTGVEARRVVGDAELWNAARAFDRGHQGAMAPTDNRGVNGTVSSFISVDTGVASSATGNLATSGVAGMAGVGQAGATGGSRAVTPAQQVAQLLGTERAGEVESVRGTASPSTADARTSNAGRETSRRSATGRQSSLGSSAQRAGETDGKTGTAERTTFDDLVRSIRLNAGARRSSAQLRLDPPELGRVHVDVRVDGERLEIIVRTETATARDLVSHHASRLAAALQEHGLSVDRFEVLTDGQEQGPSDAPDAFDAGVSDSQLFEDREYGEEDRHSPLRSDAVSPDDTAASTAWRNALPTAVAAETRLDIRV